MFWEFINVFSDEFDVGIVNIGQYKFRGIVIHPKLLSDKVKWCAGYKITTIKTYLDHPEVKFRKWSWLKTGYLHSEIQVLYNLLRTYTDIKTWVFPIYMLIIKNIWILNWSLSNQNWSMIVNICCYFHVLYIFIVNRFTTEFHRKTIIQK
jgi:hypothetical protein